MLAASYQAIKRNDHQYGPEFRAKSISINVKINSNEQGKSEGFKGESTSICGCSSFFLRPIRRTHTRTAHALTNVVVSQKSLRHQFNANKELAGRSFC